MPVYLALMVGAAGLALVAPSGELRGHSPLKLAADAARGPHFTVLGVMGGKADLCTSAPAVSGVSAERLACSEWGHSSNRHMCIGGFDGADGEAVADCEPMRLRGGKAQPKSKKVKHVERSGSGARPQ